MQIFVKTMKGGVITLDVEENETIKEVKEQIIDKEGFPCIHYFRLYYYTNMGKRFLENDKTLSDYNIQREEYIYIELKNYFKKLEMKVFYNKNILEINECTICFSSNALDIKKRIKEEFKIQIDRILIIYNDKILNDEIILKTLGKGFLELFVAKKGLPLAKVINGKDILITFNLKLKKEHQDSIKIKKSIEKYYDLPIKNQRLFFEDGFEDSHYYCNFYYEITKRCKKIIIKENNSIFSSFFKNSSNDVEIYQIFLRLEKNDFNLQQSDDLPLPEIINKKQDVENKEENELIDNKNENIIITNDFKLKFNNEEEDEIEEEIAEKKIFRTIYTSKNEYL